MIEETKSENDACDAKGMQMNAVQGFRRTYLENPEPDLKSAWSMLKSASPGSSG